MLFFHYLMGSRSLPGTGYTGRVTPPPPCLCRCVLGRGWAGPPPGDSSDPGDTDQSSPGWLNSSGTPWCGWSGCYWSQTCTSIQLNTHWKSGLLYRNISQVALTTRLVPISISIITDLPAYNWITNMYTCINAILVFLNNWLKLEVIWLKFIKCTNCHAKSALKIHVPTACVMLRKPL